MTRTYSGLRNSSTSGRQVAKMKGADVAGSSKTHSFSIKIAQKPYIVGSLGPKALRYESLEPLGLSKV